MSLIKRQSTERSMKKKTSKIKKMVRKELLKKSLTFYIIVAMHFPKQCVYVTEIASPKLHLLTYSRQYFWILYTGKRAGRSKLNWP